jgi:hypothetical protein
MCSSSNQPLQQEGMLRSSNQPLLTTPQEEWESLIVVLLMIRLVFPQPLCSFHFAHVLESDYIEADIQNRFRICLKADMYLFEYFWSCREKIWLIKISSNLCCSRQPLNITRLQAWDFTVNVIKLHLYRCETCTDDNCSTGDNDNLKKKVKSIKLWLFILCISANIRKLALRRKTPSYLDFLGNSCN